MRLADILDLIKGDQPAEQLARSKGDTGVRVSVAARPFLVASIARKLKSQRQMVLYCSQQRQAEQWVNDLESLGTPAVFLPPWDTLPSERLAPDVEIVAARMRALDALVEGGTVVVIPARASLYPVPRPEEGLHRVIKIIVGVSYDLDDLAKELVSLGFTREIRVEKQGEFALRGGIVDLYPPLRNFPVRVEFFGDVIESVRSFDPVSQVSTETIDGFELTSLSEVRVDPENGSNAAKLLEGQLAAHEWLRRDIERLQNGEYFDGAEAYLPFLYGARATVADYLRDDPLVFIDEPKIFADDALRILREEGSYLEEAASSGAIPVPPVPYLPLLSQLSVEDLISAFLDGGQADVKLARQVLAYSCPPRSSSSCISLFSIAPAGQGDTMSVDSANAEFATRDHETITKTIEGWIKKEQKIVVASPSEESARRMVEFLKSLGFPAALLENMTLPSISVVVGSLEHSFARPDLNLVIVTQHDLFGSSSRRQVRGAGAGIESAALRPLRSLSELEVGDLVVHVNHGIGKFTGLTKRTMDDSTKEYLLLEFQGADKLFLPVDSLDRITKYVGAGDTPTLSKLGGAEWRKTTNKVRKSLRKVAINLVKLYAERARSKGHPFSGDSPWQRELEESFPFQETPDQVRAIFDVKGDMENERPMDRLICGDVGYGKTEVAVRAAFKAVTDHRQVLVLVPTTLLAQQHYTTFRERFEPFPVNVELLSRFRTAAEQKKVIKGFSTGEVDVIVGTHRALSKDIQAKNLGLIIIDEEHRFGVSQKETLREARKHVDVLTLTATPIPRTLQMSLAGIRDLTIIETPPPDRQPILTMVGEFESTLVRAAIRREMAREGQIFYVHNRVQDIDKIAGKVRALVPEARVTVAHGQMSEHELERIMEAFKKREYDILVCTVIIESGLDLPNANTLIVERADNFGLAQLYQLRGRVGRSGRRAYAYFLVSPGQELTFAAGERLKTMGELTHLGAGLKLAMKDLEIRGAGNLLGGEQHGHIADVGFELYAELLKQEVAQLQEAATSGLLPAEVAADIAAGFAEAQRAATALEPPSLFGDGEGAERPEIRVELPVNAYIPESYITEEILRIEVYGLIARIGGDKGAEGALAHLTDRFGAPPPETAQLIDVCRLRARAARIGLERVNYLTPRGISSGKIAMFPIVPTKVIWDAIRERFGRFEWKRNERILEYPGVLRADALPKALEILAAIEELKQKS